MDSVVGRGTTVRLYLPRLDPARAAAVTGTAAVNGANAIPRAAPGETILLVEDNEDVRRLAVAALESLGYRVLHAVNGAAALEVLSSPDGASIDLLFTDMILPGGMNGRALADAVLAERPGLPVLFASGYAPAVAGHAAPDDSLLDKPYSTDSLALRCRQAIDRRRAPPASPPA